jgi:hypothetical protein
VHLNGAASDASLVEAPPPLYIHLGRLISAKKVPRRSAAHQFAWLRLVPGKKKMFY